MGYADEIYEVATVLRGERSEALRGYCGVAMLAVKGRLRESVTVPDFYEIFISGCAMLAVALDLDFCNASGVSSFKAGNVSVTRSSQTNVTALLKHAEALLAPYTTDNGFSFRGVEIG